MKRHLAFAAFVGALIATATTQAAQVESLRDSGPVDKRYNIVVVGDGYRDVDQAQLSTDAKTAVDYLLSVSPLKQYSGFFNVKLVHVISKETGADRGTYGDVRDTALNATYFCDGALERLLCVDDGLAQAAAAADVPEVNFTMAVVNDPKYGGSGGPSPVASIDPQSVEIIAHEVGHSMAKLADEYSSNDASIPCTGDCEPNVTLQTMRDQIKWRNWIDAATPLPTPPTNQYATVVGLFEGARYQTSGIYRPQLDCKMRELGVDYCAICKEQFIKSIWTLKNIQMVEDSSPATDAATSTTCDSVKLSVTTPPITPSTYRFVWTVDGMPQAETSNVVELAPGALSLGAHQVKVDVEDATDMVRTDPDNLLRDSRSWAVTVSKNDCPVATGGAGGSAGGSAGAANVSGMGGAPASSGNASGGSLTVMGGTPDSASGSGGTPGTSTPVPPPPEPSGCSCYVARGDDEGSGVEALAAALLVGVARQRRRRGR
jgi:hypothetical protein